jgi:3-hydroxyisobutyrate dehydrogenase-like beta-hydroxyacid dehydrogenase
MAGQSVGFIGVGRMGGRMARRLVQAGHPLTIYDTNAAMMQPLLDLGAHRAASPLALASECEIVITSLPTPPVVESVALGPGGVREGSRVRIFIDMSTTGSAYARRIAEGLASKGIVAVDAPVSGGLAGAERGTLAVMVSCPEDVLPKVKPLLEVMGKVFFCGTQPGLGQTMKLLNNLLSASALAISSEAVVMGVKAGLDPELVLDVLNSGTGRNTATADKFPRFVVPRTFNAGFAMGLFNKDLRLCLEEADALGVPMIVGTAVRQLFSVALASDGYNADITEVVKPVERWAGVEVGSRTAPRK